MRVAAGFKKTSSSTAPERCAFGTYNKENSASTPATCTDCPVGSYCPDPASDPIACSDGMECSKSKLYWADFCPAGYKCVGNSQGRVMTKCAAGTYALGGAVTCTACPAGYMCPSYDSYPKICPRGTFAIASQTTCTFCETTTTATKALIDSGGDHCLSTRLCESCQGDCDNDD